MRRLSIRERSGASLAANGARWRASQAPALVLMLGALWFANSSTNAGIGKTLGAIGEHIGLTGTPTAAPPAAQPPSAAAPVRVGEAVRRDLAVIRRTPGTVIANTAVQITSQVQGIIESANFK